MVPTRNHPHAAVPTKVTLSGYSIAVTETTKRQWDAVREWAASRGCLELPAGEGKKPDEPVRHVTWHQALIWCNAASERKGLTPPYRVKGEVYRIGNPDDVECDWKAYGYGLYNMTGNALEWCWDWYGSYASGSGMHGELCVDPNVHPAVRGSRVLRGGDRSKEATYARVAYRHSSFPGRSSPNIGFRVARSDAATP